MPKIRYLAVTTKKYHDNRVRAVLDTWGAICGNELFFMSDADGWTPQIVALPCGTDYSSAPGKLVKGLLALPSLGSQDYDWVFIADDDTYLFVENLENVLTTADSTQNICYCHIAQHYPQLPELRYPAGGPGYAISRKTLELLLPLLPQAKLYPYTDVTLGVCLEQIGTTLVDVPGMYNLTPKKMAERMAENNLGTPISKPISFHYMTPDEMHTLHRDKFLFV